MRRLSRLRPSPAMVVALAALVVALGGTAYAAHLINGKLIKKNSIPANRMKRHSITGTQMNLKKLGKVPLAANADNATNAGIANLAKNATTADSANTANTAKDANTVGGTNQARLFANVPSGPNTKTVLDTGFVKLVASCAGGPGLTATSEANHEVAQFGMVGDGGTPQGQNRDFSTGAQMNITAGNGNGSGAFGVATPDGHVLSVNYSFTSGNVFGGAAGCAFSGSASWG